MITITSTADVPEQKSSSSKPLKWFLAFMAKGAKLMKAVKSLKIMLTVCSFLAFAFCQSAINGIAIGFGITFLLLVHEAGHVAAMARRGLQVKLPVFIPFLGAAIVSREIATVDRHTESYIGYGGPLIGTIFSMGIGVIAGFTASPVLLSIAVMGVFLNLFNMIPMSPLDGGRITQSIHPNAVYFGACLMVAVTLCLRDPGILLIWIIIVSNFDYLSYAFRFWLSLVVYITMVALFLTHSAYTDSTSTEAWVDALMGAVFTFGAYGAWDCYKRDGEDNAIQTRMARPYPAFSTKAAWFGLWMGTVAVQVVALSFMISHLPHSPAKQTPPASVS